MYVCLQREMQVAVNSRGSVCVCTFTHNSVEFWRQIVTKPILNKTKLVFIGRSIDSQSTHHLCRDTIHYTTQRTLLPFKCIRGRITIDKITHTKKQQQKIYHVFAEMRCLYPCVLCIYFHKQMMNSKD